MDSCITAFVAQLPRTRHRLAALPVLLAAVVVFFTALCPGAAAATKPGDIITYSLDGSQPGPITAGPDGNLWFGEYNASSGVADVGKITTTGIATIYSIPGTGYGPAERIEGGGGKCRRGRRCPHQWFRRSASRAALARSSRNRWSGAPTRQLNIQIWHRAISGPYPNTSKL